MRFTIEQYQKAIANIAGATTQLTPDSHPCMVCGDSGHQAFECGRNPLVAMQMCEMVTKRARELHDALHELEKRFPAVADLFTVGKVPSSSAIEAAGAMADDAQELVTTTHEFLHFLAGFNVHLGMQVGPARVILPEGKP